MTKEERLIRIVRSLPADVPDPEFVIEEGGDYGLDWYREPRRTITLCVYDDKIGFAYLRDEDSSHGSFLLESDGRLPDSIVSILRYVVA